MKFAISRGEKIDEIPNLKEYLQDQIKTMKAKKNVRGVPIDKAKNNGRGGNNSNKFYAFSELDDGNDTDWLNQRNKLSLLNEWLILLIYFLIK